MGYPEHTITVVVSEDDSEVFTQGVTNALERLQEVQGVTLYRTEWGRYFGTSPSLGWYQGSRACGKRPGWWVTRALRTAPGETDGVSDLSFVLGLTSGTAHLGGPLRGADGEDEGGGDKERRQ